MLVCVKEGKHDFKPVGGVFEIPWILPSGLTFKWDFVFDDSCIYQHQDDNDLKYDYNKGGGVSMSMFSNNKNAALWAWRASDHSDHIQVGPYFNVNGGIVFPIKTVSFMPGEGGSVRIKRKRKNWTISVTNNATNESVEQTHKIKRPWFIKTVGAWFGGYDNDQNGLRGIAPQDMCFTVIFKL